MIRWLTLLSLLLGCPQASPPTTHGTGDGDGTTGDETAEDAPESLPTLADQGAWDALAYRPDYQTAARTEVVKCIIDLEDTQDGAWRTYFLDSSRYELHYSYVRARIDPDADHATFNVQQYRRPDRRFILVSLVRYLDSDFWTLELVAGDTLDAPRLLRAFELVRGRVFFGDDLRFRPLAPRHEERVAELGGRIPVVHADEIMRGTRYQAIVPGRGYGYLRLVRGELDVSMVRPTDILVTEQVPDELPPCAALVTSALQAPLAHVAILSRNRGTPDMALREAITDERITSLEGRLVKIEVGPQDFSLTEASRDDAEAFWASRRPTETYTPPVERAVERLYQVCDLRLEDARFAGAKASQLGEVCGLGDIETPGGFVVPFHYYLGHLDRHRLGDGIRQMLADGAFREDRGERGARLSELRGIIEGAEVDPTLVRDVWERLQRSDARWIFRSSTNAEDLVGFNGAGLYRSIIVDAHPTRDQVATALRQVWSSVWLQRAFEERDWYRIDHVNVAMAILVQELVDDVVGNGVAITRNPFDEGRPGVYVNVQTREGSVTGAGTGEVPEQVIIYTWSEDLEFEVVSRSSRTDGAPILSEADLRALGTVLQRLHDELSPLYGTGANAVDVEMLLTRGDRRFVIVQARPIDVRYTEGQGWRTP